jgi:hypothetical protein
MTLGDYHRFAVHVFGKDSEATKYLDRRIELSPNGADEQVLADTIQVLILLTTLAEKKGDLK